MTRFGNRFDDILDVVERVGNTGVLGFRTVVEIDGAIGQHGNVFQQSVAFDGVIDIWFSFFRQLDGFGVATALEVEHAIVVPAVFVIADQQAIRIGGQRGFTGARQAEEYRYIAFIAHVG